MSLMGIDVGTTGCKVAVYTETGVSLAHSYREYGLLLSDEAIALDPDVVFDRVLACMREVAGQLKTSVICGISVSAMTDTITAVGHDGRALLPSMISFDRRGAVQARRMEAGLGGRQLFCRTGMPLHPSHSICKLLWMKEHCPHAFSQTWKFMCYEEYILWRLGAEPATSYSSASKTMLLDAEQMRWSIEMLDYCGIALHQLPDSVPSGSVVGKLSPEIAQETGFMAGVPLVTGGFDQACCALSCGITKAGDVLDTTGTNEILFFALPKEQRDGLLEHGMDYSPHVIPEQHCSYASVINAGGAFRWCRDALFPDLAAEDAQGAYNAMTARMRESPERVLFFPFLTGVGTPEMTPEASGLFCGLTLQADRYSLAQAILEGVTFELRYNLEIVREILNQPNPKLVAAGGATKSPYWLQLKSNVNNIPFLVPENLEQGTSGAAMLAGIGCGLFSEADEAVSAFHHRRTYREYLPEKQAVPRYQEAYQQYRIARASLMAERPLIFGGCSEEGERPRQGGI